MIILDTPCTAGARSTGRLNILSVWIHSRPVSNGDSFQSVFSRMPSLSHPKNHFWALFSSWRHQRQFKAVWFLHPLPNVKVTWSLFALFFQKCHFFSSKKGSPNRPVPLANSINGHPVFGSRKINGSNYRKDLQWSTLQMPLAKINYFPKPNERNAHQFFFTTGWIERFAQK